MSTFSYSHLKVLFCCSRISWVKTDSSGLSLEYPHVAIHAICRDVSKFPHREHIYVMIDSELFPTEEGTIHLDWLGIATYYLRCYFILLQELRCIKRVKVWFSFNLTL